jgi:uncharacterized membrane protein
MTLFVAVVQWLHVVAAILWVGGTVCLEVLVVPTTMILPLPEQRALGERLGRRAGTFFALTGAATLFLGIIRGTLAGPIQSFAALDTNYGLTWLAALALTSGLGFWGARVVGPAAERLYVDPSVWAPDPLGLPTATLEAARQRMAMKTRVQLIGFAAVLVCMILMAEVFS